jgi:DNA-binding transcriptional ArsR family regulator
MADKSEVLNLLRARGDDWTSPAQIRASIHVPDRTLRNWLRDLVEEGAIERRGERKGRRYRLVGRSVAIVPATGTLTVQGQTPAVVSIFTAESQALIKRVEAPLYTRPPATHREDWLQTYVPNKSAYLHVPSNVEPQHREKFISDVLAELEYLDASRIGGLGLTREELEAWQELRHQG